MNTIPPPPDPAPLDLEVVSCEVISLLLKKRDLKIAEAARLVLTRWQPNPAPELLEQLVRITRSSIETLARQQTQTTVSSVV